MYNKKKIGVFISHLMGDFQKNVCQGIMDTALKYGYNSEVFEFMDGEDLGSSDLNESAILETLDFDNFKGIIFAFDTFVSDALRQHIYDILHERCHCHIVQISPNDTSYPTVYVDNNKNTAELVEHLADVHNCKRICYLGCSTEKYFSDLRNHYYTDAMQSRSLSIGRHDVFEAVYSEESADEALDFFLQDKRPIDAVVCYNDRIALHLLSVATQRGYSIPDDFAVTGCDNLSDGQNITPSLTTVSFPSYELGAKTVDELVALFHNEEVPPVSTIYSEVLYGTSCGCPLKHKSNSIKRYRMLSSRIERLESNMFSSIRMVNTFQQIFNIDDCMDALEDYTYLFENCSEFYLCLYSDWDSMSDSMMKLTDSDDIDSRSRHMIMKLGIRNGKRLPECSYRIENLLPDMVTEFSDSNYVYTPLYFMDHTFGYAAMAFTDGQLDYHLALVNWFMNVSQMLQRLRDAKHTAILAKRLEAVYMRDPMTNLYNKHGYLNIIDAFLEKSSINKEPVSCFVFDLDGLKGINDNYGHIEGDFAIQVIAHALCSVIKPDDICSHFSGDEFYLIGTDYDDDKAMTLLSRVEKYLINYNNLSTKEYTISVSGGYALSDDTFNYSQDAIEELLQIADKNMYEQKKTKKAQ